ncbi:MAG: T9SS type A sorting domain-containing protein, partial [Vicingaceae bacterium]
HYQVNAGSVFTSNHSVYLNTLEETSIVADSTFDFDPTQNYQFKSWISVAADVDLSNDTLSGNLQNTTSNLNSVGLPIYEDFSNSIPGSGVLNLNSQLISNWTTDSIGGSNWRISDGNLNNHSANTAAASGMRGRNNNYIYYEVSGTSAGDRAFLESPCLTLPNDTSLNLSFGYHKYGTDMGNLLIQVSTNSGNWILLDNIIGQTHTSSTAPWLKKVISLKDYAGQVVKVRFVGVAVGSFRGDMAIDNILISDTSFIDLAVEELETQSACYLSNQEQVSVRVHNYGDSLILPNTVNMHYQVDNQNLVSEFIPDTIFKDSSYLFQFSQTVDLSQYNRTYDFLIYGSLQGDLIHTNDSLQNRIYNYTQTVNNLEDFEQVTTTCFINQSDSSNLPIGWSYDTTNSHYAWITYDPTFCNLSPSTGATSSDSTGPSSAYSGRKFLYFEASHYINETIKSTCFDASNQSQLALEFYYHKYGRSMTDLIVEIEDSSGVINSVDTILGQTHSTFSDPWLKRTINLNQFANQQFKILFRTSSLPVSFHSDMALDDIRIYNPLTVSSDGFEAAEKPLTLYPNPSKGQYFIQSEESLAGLNYQVYNLRGQLIQSGNFEGKRESLNLSSQPNGVYFLSIPKLKLREKLVKY